MPAKKTAPTKTAAPAAKKAATGKKRRTPSHKAAPHFNPTEELSPEQRASISAASEIVRNSGLDMRRQLFVIEFAKDGNGTQAIIRAGFTGNEGSASVMASRLLGEVQVKQTIDAVMNDRVDRGLADGDAVIAIWTAQSQADANSLTQYRRVCCRYCWGKGFRYQFTPAELEEARAEHERQWRILQAKMKGKAGQDLDDVEPPPFDEKGGVGYRGNRDPHPECPECWGEGVGRPFFTDTRKIPEKDKVLFAGVKQGKEGIEILMHDPEGARDKLARHYGLYRDKLAEAVAGTYTPDQLESLFGANIGKARERQAKVDAERGVSRGNGEE